ncbi:hypothetical protein RRG08_052186 [Elysia crispata]|uniref:Down syndrome cell adhesion molecule n=1 Tax=Elysia crispata TaxID=231223 RepID=A0AAE0Z013_9GAST|nr:hypothetical protein RRG08_052186 [Elysia crispata]
MEMLQAVHGLPPQCYVEKKDRTLASVLVEQYTQYHVTLNDEWVMRGGTTALRCVIDPTYVTDYVKVIGWKRAGHELHSSGRVSILRDGVLHIRGVQAEDTGRLSPYTCITRNILTGENRTSDGASITLHDPPAGGARPSIDESLDHVTISQGETIELPCAASQAYPAPSFTWVKDDVTLVIDGRRLTQHGGNLHLRNATVFDSGVYQCTGRNSHGSGSANTLLTVTSPLSVLIEPTQQTVDAGHSAQFNCTTFGHPVNSVEWFHNGRPLVASTSDPEARVTLSQGRHLLLVKDVGRQDQGMYQCFVSNARDSAQGAGQLALGAAKPVLLDAFQEQFVKMGQKVTLHCKFSGNPIPEVTWSLDGAGLPTESALAWNSFVTMEGDVMSYVNISRVSVPLGGEYSCYAASKVGTATHTNRLNVYGTPYIKPMPNVTATASKNLTLRCYVSGYPLESIHWTRRGAQLPINHRQTLPKKGTLVIGKVQKGDSGSYTCVARNREGKGMERSMHVAVVEPPRIDTFQFGKRKQGDRIMVICAIVSGDLPITIQWEKDGRAIPKDMGVIIQQLGEYSILSINNVSPMHDGNYTCYVRNAAATVNYTDSLQIEVPPRWVVEPQDSYVILHQSVRLDCQADGTPAPEVIWKKAEGSTPGNYTKLEFDHPDVNHRRLLPNGTLILTHAREEDHGYYLCHASNGVGFDISKIVMLTVHIPARFNEPRKNYTVKKGQAVTLECQAVGDKPLSIDWSFNESELTDTSDARFTIVAQDTPRGKLSQLTIKPSDRDDSGNYTCLATNKFGQRELLSHLIVHEPPEPPKELVVVNVTSREAFVTWKRPFDGNSPITNFTVQYINATGKANQPDHQLHCSVHQCYSASMLQVRRTSPITNFTVQCISATGKATQPDHQLHCLVHQCYSTSMLQVRRPSPITNFTVQYINATGKTTQPNHKLHCSVHQCYSTSVLQVRRPSPITNFTVQYISATGKATQPDHKLHCSVHQCYSTSMLQVRRPSPITNFTVQYINATGKANQRSLVGLFEIWQGVIPNVTVKREQLYATLTSLLPAFKYHIRVIALNAVGKSESSNVVDITTEEEAPTGPPDRVVVQAVSSQALKVIWDPPVLGYQNGKILGYYIGYKETLNPVPASFIYQTHIVQPASSDKKSTTNEHTITNLKKFTQYSVRVKAYNAKGISPASTDINVFTLEDVPSQPPEGVQATPLSSDSVKVAWSPPPLFTLHGILQGYKILYKPVRLDEDESDANFQTSPHLEIVLFGLEKFTNYSVQVLAYTRKGEGVRSEPVYVTTREDVPDAPARIKALATNDSAILISWMPPARPNGIIRGYTLYFNNQSSPEVEDILIPLSADSTHYMMGGLPRGVEFAFRCSASTVMGEGRSTKYISTSTLVVAPARIASFPVTVTQVWHEDVTFPCVTVGSPPPVVTWRLRNGIVNNSDGIRVLRNGSLVISSVTGSDAANYTCHAENPHGSSQITYTLKVQVGDHRGTPPHPPHLYLVLTTTSTIQVNWLSGSNGGSPIQGFVLNYKMDYQSWQSLSMGPTNRTFIANNLRCGTSYKFSLRARNKLGDSLDSQLVTASTNGSAPIIAPQSLLLVATNATSVTLDLSSWQTSGCPIRFYSIRYQVWGDETWHLVSNHIQHNATLFVVQDLNPATWYIMDVIAHSDAGSTTSRLKFATLTFAGSTIKPLKVLHKERSEFYQKAYLMIPVCAAIVFLLSLLVAVFLFCRRRKDRLRYKDYDPATHTVNLRRDITAETSLMNDLDKRLNTDLDLSSSSSGTLAGHARHANLLGSPVSEDNLPGHSSSAWLIAGSNKTTSDNGSFGRSDDNINPYATYNEIKPTTITHTEVRTTTVPLKGAAVPKSSSEEDDIALQKAAARREMEDYQSKKAASSSSSSSNPKGPPSESYVPFFHSDVKREKQARSTGKRQPPPPLPAPRRMHQKEAATKDGYDNEGAILSPRRYASADQIHALFTQPARPHSSVKSGSESTDKGSQRHSLISSVTTVSSSRDELLDALENAKRCPPPPVLYESENDPHIDGGTEGDLDPDSSSQPTDSSVTTEPGIRMFTQSPPKPNEQRQASCEVPAYEQQQKRRRPQRMEVESDTNDAPPTALRRPLPPRKVRPRHRGKQRGQMTGKRPLGTFMPRTQSGTSTTSTNSEEVTYSFGAGRAAVRGGDKGLAGGRSTGKSGGGAGAAAAGGRATLGATGGDIDRAQTPRSSSPGDGGDPQPFTAFAAATAPPAYEAGFVDFPSETARIRRGGRRTPHARVRYDNTAQTPGTDEHRPLVTSLAHTALATSPEEEESVSLIDRHYRPVPEEDTEMDTRPGKKSKSDKGYTDDFTIV